MEITICNDNMNAMPNLHNSFYTLFFISDNNMQQKKSNTNMLWQIRRAMVKIHIQRI